MDALKKPIRRQLAAYTLRLRFAVNRRADGGKLKAHADVIEEAGRLLRIGAPFGLACHQILEIGRAQPKWMLDIHLTSMGRPFADDIDRIMGGDPFFAITGDEV